MTKMCIDDLKVRDTIGIRSITRLRVMEIREGSDGKTYYGLANDTLRIVYFTREQLEHDFANGDMIMMRRNEESVQP